METPRRTPPAPLPESLNQLSEKIIGCAIRVHRELGPALLESAYEGALCIELAVTGLQFLRQQACPVTYRDQLVGEYRLDVIVEDSIVVEVKSVGRIDPVFTAQVLTYLRATGKRLGLIINFGAPVLSSGVRRVVL